MPSPTDFFDALVHYRTKFPDLASLGDGSPPDTWKAEIDRVEAIAFDALLATGANLEGGNVSGQMNFGQKNLVRALYARRAELDTAYTNPYTQAAADPMPPVRSGFIVSLLPAS